jgi:transmembrane sensor
MRRDRAVNEKDKASLGRWDAALSWYSKLRAADEKELTSEVGRDWEAWYADADNRRVFDRVSLLLSQRDRYRARPRPSQGELEEDGYDLSVPIAEYLGAHRPEETERERSSAGRRWWLSTGVAVLAAIVVLFALSPMRLWLTGDTNRPTPYQTGIGELKDVHLSDGSSITLGGQTKLLVTFSQQRRSVELIEGQAWFTVAHNLRWPFVVAAGDGTITAVGTAFLVTRDSDRVVVTVTEGVVEVSARPTSKISSGLDHAALGTPALAPIQVSRGEELAFRDNGALSHIKHADTQAAIAWTHGRLTFDDQPLRYVIETVDRYSSRRIVVSPSAGGLRFTGIVFDSEIDDWLQSLEGIFPVTIREQGNAVRIEMRPSTPETHELPRTTRP